jgi:hypothetical protein
MLEEFSNTYGLEQQSALLAANPTLNRTGRPIRVLGQNANGALGTRLRRSSAQVIQRTVDLKRRVASHDWKTRPKPGPRLSGLKSNL